MRTETCFAAFVVGVLALVGMAADSQPASAPGEVTLKGSLFCNGASIPEPKEGDHVLVLYAIDGTDAVRGEVEKIMADFWPDKGLDAEAAVKLMDQFTLRLKYLVSPDSPALKDAKDAKGHYCQAAAASAVTGVIVEKDGKRWLTATKIAPAKLKYPDKMLAPDKPFVLPDKAPLVLKITDKLTLTCVAIPAGRFLMGTPFY